MKKIFTGLVIVFSLFLMNPALASVIKLETSVTSGVESNVLHVIVSAVNRGDEPAHNVQAEIHVGSRSALGDRLNQLPVAGTYRSEFRLPVDLSAPGCYPLVLTMNYADANHYPFSALTAQTFVCGREAIPPVIGQVENLAFWHDGKLRVTLKNMGDHEIRATTRLIVPHELTVTEESRELMLRPKGETKSMFMLKNFSALQGSVYQVYVVSEFEDGDLHFTSVAPGTVTLADLPRIFGLRRDAVIAILVVLVAVFIGVQFITRR